MRPKRVLTTILLSGAFSVLLKASGPAWIPIPMPEGTGVTLKYRIFQADGNWFVEFRNDSPTKVHFNYRFKGLQNKKESLPNGRVHLNALKGHGQLPLPSLGSKASPALLATIPIQVFNVRVAATDHGTFAKELD